MARHLSSHPAGPAEGPRPAPIRPQYDPEMFGRLSERVARFIGSARFIGYMTVFIVAWVAWNTVGPEDLRFDPFPFIFLTLMLSLQASYAAPLILLAQNRQADRDRVQYQEDRDLTERLVADTEYLTREIAALRIAIGDLATRDFLRGEVRDLAEELTALLSAEAAETAPGTPRRAARILTASDRGTGRTAHRAHPGPPGPGRPATVCPVRRGHTPGATMRTYTEASTATPQRFADEFLSHLRLDRAVDLETAGRRDVYAALAHTVRDRLMADWLVTVRDRGKLQSKTVVYLSAEYLLGRQLGNALLATGLTDVAREALAGLGLDLDEIADLEVEPGLGNGGLGRLAACFADSLATLGRPAIGYGICYEYGIFEQSFEDGRQVEKPDQWLEHDNPWLFSQREHAVEVGFGGHVDVDPATGDRVWHPAEKVMGVPHNLLVPGYRNQVVNTLRLWKARGSSQFNLEVFNAGDYIEAVRQQSMSENISRVLYPEDSTPAGKELRLRQQYFFTACALADLVRVADLEGIPLQEIPDRVVIQLNDTHPVIAIPELMRILIDERGLDYDTAWDITSRTFNYTCHTLMPEALERWSVGLLSYLLPRHMELIYRINKRFLEQVRATFPMDALRIIHMSIIEEGPERMVRMANLAAVASAHVNGVAALHSQLLRDTVLRDFAEMWPEQVHQRHQRRDPAAVPQAGQPAPERPDHRDRGRRLAHRPRAAGRAGGQRRGPRVPAALARGQAGQQGQPRGPARAADRARVPDRSDVRHHGQAPARVQAPDAQAAAHGDHVPAAAAGSRCGAAPEGDALRGEGGPGLPDGQADHPADQPGGRDHRRRPGDGRAPVGGVPGQLQRDPGRADHPRRGPVRADLDGRQGGLGDRQHEAGAERRADDRHARRRERRDPRAGRRRELLPVRPDRGRGRGAQGRGVRPRGGVPPGRRAAGRSRRDRERVLLPARRARPVPPDRRQPAPARRVPRAGRLPVVRRGAGEGRRDCGPTRLRGPRCRSATPPAPASSPPTARCTTTSSESGGRGASRERIWRSGYSAAVGTVVFRRIVAVGAVAAMLAGGWVRPAQAASNRGWPVTPDSFGIMYGSTDPDTISAVRAWEAATWCTIQPTPDADMQAILTNTLGSQLDAQRATGATAAIVGLGHPPAWVFDNDRRAVKHVVQYGCADNAASGVSIPRYASLKRGRSGELPLQAQRWSTYVSAVIDFLNTRYGQSMNILLQVWNEPNLTSGLSVRTRVPGSSHTKGDAVNALYELERITRDAALARGNPAITLTSTALLHRPNKFARLYLAKQGRRPVVSSLSFNLYGYRVRAPDAMVRQWDRRARSLRSRVNRYPRLRRLPAHLGETNLNLVNNTHDKSNLAARVTNPDTQRRLATAVQMDAFYNGFRSVYWLSGPQVQAAVNIGHQPGNASRTALTVLRGQLINSVIQGCRTRSGVRSCLFLDPAGLPITVYWRMSRSSTVPLPATSIVVRMTGEITTEGAGTRLPVGTTPIVVRLA